MKKFFVFALVVVIATACGIGCAIGYKKAYEYYYPCPCTKVQFVHKGDSLITGEAMAPQGIFTNQSQ